MFKIGESHILVSLVNVNIHFERIREPVAAAAVVVTPGIRAGYHVLPGHTLGIVEIGLTSATVRDRAYYVRVA